MESATWRSGVESYTWRGGVESPAARVGDTWRVALKVPPGRGGVVGTPTARRTVCATIHWMHTDFVVLVVCLVFLYVMSLASHTSFTPYLIVCHEVLKNFLEPDQ